MIRPLFSSTKTHSSLGKVAIIIVNYNSSEETLLCLKSLSRIDYWDYSVFVVDNGSSKNDYKNLGKKMPSYLQLIRSDQNTGFAGGVNIGIKAAKAINPAFFLVLNNDVAVDKKFLSYLLRTLGSDKSLGIAGPLVYDFHQKNKVTSAGISFRWHTFVFPNSLIFSNSTLPIYPYKVDAVEGSAFLIKSEVIERVGLLDTSYFLQCEEVDYCIKAKYAGFECVIVPSSKVWHKGGASSTKKGYSREILFYITRGRVRIAKRYFGDVETLRLSILYLVPVVKRFLSGKTELAFWQLRGIVNAWLNTSGPTKNSRLEGSK